MNGEDGRLFQGIYGALSSAFAEVQVYCVSRPDRLGEVQNSWLWAFPEKGGHGRGKGITAEEAGANADAGMAAMLATRLEGPLVFDTPPPYGRFCPWGALCAHAAAAVMGWPLAMPGRKM